MLRYTRARLQVCVHVCLCVRVHRWVKAIVLKAEECRGDGGDRFADGKGDIECNRAG